MWIESVPAMRDTREQLLQNLSGKENGEVTYEIVVGIVGAGFVILSFLQKSIKLTYGLNSVGCIFLLAYSYILSNWVFVGLNGMIFLITAYDFMHWKRKGFSKIYHKHKLQ